MSSEKLARKIEKHYASHGVPLKLRLRGMGSDRTRYNYEVALHKGAKESLVFKRAIDIRTALQIPFFQPFYDGMKICLVVSETSITNCNLIPMLKSRKFNRSRMRIPIALGYNLMGETCFADLTQFPHLVLGGATNSGKTMCLRNLVLSVVFKQDVNRVNFAIIDTGANDLDIFCELPHLSCPIVKEEEEAVKTFLALSNEMERRRLLEVDELRSLPAIVCVVDEYNSLISNANTENKQRLVESISNLLRRGRHAKIHMIFATQETAKQDMQINLNNFNVHIAFACSDFYSSRAILGMGGAENLPGKGAMLFKPPGVIKPIYLQGAYASERDMEQIITFILSKKHDASNKYIMPNDVDCPPSIGEATDDSIENTNIPKIAKELSQIILWALSQNEVSALKMKDKFHIGNRANEFIDHLFKAGIITEKHSNMPRKVIPQAIDDVPADVMDFLFVNDVATEDVETAFKNREQTNRNGEADVLLS